jgi:hypothetical protein
VRRIWRWTGIVLLCVLLYTVFLVVFAPADYAVRALAHFSRGVVAIHQPSGNLWNGRGTLVITPRGGPAATGQIQWSLSPWPLFLGNAVVKLDYKSDDIAAQGIVHASSRRYAVTDFTATAPTTVADKLYPPAAILGLSGTMRLTAPTFELTPDGIEGKADILWQGASSRLLQLPSTGDYNVQLTGREKRIEFQVNTVKGDLQISAQGDWRAMDDGVLRVQGTIWTATPQPQLEPMLNAIGPAQADGRRHITQELRLAPLKPEQLFR